MKESFSDWLVANLSDELGLDDLEEGASTDDIDADYVLNCTSVDDDELSTYAQMFNKSCIESGKTPDWDGFEDYEK